MLNSIINKILIKNQGSLNLLQTYSGKSFIINAVGLINLKATIGSDGLLIDLKNAELVDTHIEILPQVISGMVNNDKLEMLQSIQISGDKHFGLNILEILSNLQIINILAQTDSIPILIVINVLRKFISGIKNQLILMTQNSTQSITQYLQYESTDIMNKYEIEHFCNEVDELRERTELLIKRVNLLNMEQP